MPEPLLMMPREKMCWKQPVKRQRIKQSESAAEGIVRAGFGLGELRMPRNCLWRET